MFLSNSCLKNWSHMRIHVLYSELMSVPDVPGRDPLYNQLYDTYPSMSNNCTPPVCTINYKPLHAWHCLWWAYHTRSLWVRWMKALLENKRDLIFFHWRRRHKTQIIDKAPRRKDGFFPQTEIKVQLQVPISISTIFLAVQNSSIYDLVSHSLSHWLTEGTFTFDI